jgi:hypothetical protein
MQPLYQTIQSLAGSAAVDLINGQLAEKYGDTSIVTFFDDFEGYDGDVPAVGTMSEFYAVKVGTDEGVAFTQQGYVHLWLGTTDQLQSSTLSISNGTNFTLRNLADTQNVGLLKVEAAVVTDDFSVFTDNEFRFGLIHSDPGVEFALLGSNEWKCRCNGVEAASGVYVTPGAVLQQVLLIDASDAAHIKFYINGDRVCAGTTFDATSDGASNVAAQLRKPGGSNNAQVFVDYIKITRSGRSTVIGLLP